MTEHRLRTGNDQRKPTGFALVPVAGVVAFALFAGTASPFVWADDVAEFQTLGASPGIAHAGYPLLCLALELADRLPVATHAYRANLVSAASGAIAVALAVLSVLRITTSRLAAAVAGTALALSYSLWHDATHAEIYAFTLALGGATFLALTSFSATRSTKALYLTSLFMGFGLTSHLSSLAVAIVAGTYLAVEALRRRLTPSMLTAAGLGLACGLLPFLWTLHRDVPSLPMNYIELTFDRWSSQHVPWSPSPVVRVGRLVHLLSGSQFLETEWYHPFKDLLLRMKLLGIGVALNDLPGIGVVLALLGAALAALRRSVTDVFLVAWLLVVLFLAGYAAYDTVLPSFFLPGLWVLVHFLGMAVAKAERRPGLAAVLAVAIIGAGMARPLFHVPPAPARGHSLLESVWSRFPAEWSPFRRDPSWELYGRGVMRGVEPGSTILYCWQEGTVLLYLQHAERVRRDVRLVPACRNEARQAEAIDRAVRAGSPVYSVIRPENVAGRRAWETVGTWPRGGLWRIRGPASDDRLDD